MSGHSNPGIDKDIGEDGLEFVIDEKSLGVNILQGPSRHIARIEKTANKLLIITRRTCVDKSTYNIIRLYKTLTRLHLE